jgi:hypothetical protein
MHWGQMSNSEKADQASADLRKRSLFADLPDDRPSMAKRSALKPTSMEPVNATRLQ